MALYLVQHGKSLSKDQDPEKGLSDEGKLDSGRIAKVAAGYNIGVSQIGHSGKKRALQTAQIFADILQPEKETAEVSGIGPLDSVREFAENIDPAENKMVVGHLPFMEKLVSFLTCGDEEKTVFKFQNSGIVCLDVKEDGWYVKWALMPHIS